MPHRETWHSPSNKNVVHLVTKCDRRKRSWHMNHALTQKAHKFTKDVVDADIGYVVGRDVRMICEATAPLHWLRGTEYSDGGNT